MPLRGQVLSPASASSGAPPIRLGADGYALPYWETRDHETVRLYLGHVVDLLAALPERSVHMVVTSPPYWGLREYNTGRWEGGDPSCDHLQPQSVNTTSTLKNDGRPAHLVGHRNYDLADRKVQYKGTCRKCGAKRVDLQIGSEPLPDCGRFRSPALDSLLRGDLSDAERAEAVGAMNALRPYLVPREPCGRCFVCSMVGVFRGLRRVLRNDGLIFLNLGDSYTSGGRDTFRSAASTNKGQHVQNGLARPDAGLASGNLVGVPWRVALALQADGWILRQDLIWAKPSPMPESVRNRCTKAHEYVFLLAKRKDYFCDMEAVKETSFQPEGEPRLTGDQSKASAEGFHSNGTKGSTLGTNQGASTRNRRSVWNVSSLGYPGAHFAVYPPELIRPMIRAGTSAYGACAECGAPWRRVIESLPSVAGPPINRRLIEENVYEQSLCNADGTRKAQFPTQTVGWEPTCSCFLDREKRCRTCGADWVAEEASDSNWSERKAAGASGGDKEVGANRNHGVGTNHTLPPRPSPTVEREMPCACFVSRVVPCVVLDPFVGSGTTAAVAIEEGRRSVGIDLNEEYLVKNAIPRVEGKLGSRPNLADLVPLKETPAAKTVAFLPLPKREE